MIFENRQHAGKLLTQELKKQNIRPDLVSGLARGGIVVAAEIAAAFQVPLEVLIVRKIGAPADPEFAVGAIAAIPGLSGSEPSTEGSEPSMFAWWDEDIIRRLRLSPDWKKRQINDKKIEISNYLSQIYFTEKAARSGSKLSNFVLVDDGAATGATMLAAIGAIRKASQGLSLVIVALPVASTAAAAKIKQQADETVILSVDPDFRAVGQYYREFSQVSWDEVKTLLQLNREA